MPKKSRRSGQKKASKRGAVNPPTNFVENVPSKNVSKDDKRRVLASRWGTILSVLTVGILFGLYYASQPGNCTMLTNSGPVAVMISKLLGAYHPANATFTRTCQRVHDVTGSFLFLSGETTSTKIDPQKGFSGVMSQASRLFGKETNVASSSFLSTTYAKDPRDILFAITWGIVLLAIRGILMIILLLPAARRFVKKPSSDKSASPQHQRKYHRNIERFAEQFWVFILYSTSLALVLTAKMLKYMGWQKTCDAMFGAFMITWTLTRHVGYCFVWISCIYDAPRLIAYRSPIDLKSGYLFNATIYGAFVVLLGVLQCILLVWFSMILKVTYRVLTQAGAIDSRSDEDSN
ncbi:sphingosine N-acyltransferase [Malassezia psittaci]|uniref:Sphingosine N-acyltransferase n=1 Tax=Malassezia psittaci TaxID=1821823 RepID=A0AAF0F8T8_9BASI|nr:sphingosine N-acyltransferase [Malassezia psittaci]